MRQLAFFEISGSRIRYTLRLDGESSAKCGVALSEHASRCEQLLRPLSKRLRRVGLRDYRQAQAPDDLIDRSNGFCSGHARASWRAETLSTRD
ncbi:hypothetical protein Tco_0200316 [Tanacetum coccineum]